MAPRVIASVRPVTVLRVSGRMGLVPRDFTGDFARRQSFSHRSILYLFRWASFSPDGLVEPLWSTLAGRATQCEGLSPYQLPDAKSQVRRQSSNHQVGPLDPISRHGTEGQRSRFVA